MTILDTDKTVALYQSLGNSNKLRRYDHWHASSIADCPRAHFYKRLGVKPLTKASGAKVIRWGAGHKLEGELRSHIDKVWGSTTSNIRLTSDTLDLTGEYDNLTIDAVTLVEVKSVSDWAFYTKGAEKCLKQATGRKNEWGKDEYGPKDTPYLPHEYQNHAYVLLLAEQHLNVKFIDYVYASLSGLLCVYHTEVDPLKLTWVKNRLERLNKAWRDKRLPPCICKPESELWGPTYQWCDYRTDNGCCSDTLFKGAPRDI